MKLVAKTLTAMAIASLAVAQPAAAATRSANALPSQTTQIEAIDRAAAPVTNAEEAGAGVPLALLIGLFGAVAIAIIAITESSGDSDSPG